MHLKNDSKHFGLIAIIFHWLMAVLIIGMLIIGLYMITLPSDPQKFKLYDWHKAFGVIILSLVSLRLIWRIINTTPSLILPWYEKLAARAVHWAFYGLMFAMPFSGWLMTTAAGYKVSFFGLFTLPNLIAPNKEYRQIFAQAHEWLAYALIALIILHTIAALKHHFIDKDDILKRMIS